MTSRDFAFWLQGLFELAEPTTLNEKQTDLIKRHLALVFIHEIDPSHSNDPKVQGALQAVHDGVDTNALRERVARLEKAPHVFDGKAINRPTPRSGGGGGVDAFMC